MLSTRSTRRDRIAVWYPEPVPTSSTRSVGRGRIASLMNATMYGWEIVCPSPIGSGPSS